MDSDAASSKKSSVAPTVSSVTSGETPPVTIPIKKIAINEAAFTTAVEATANESSEKVAATTTAVTPLPKKMPSAQKNPLGSSNSRRKADDISEGSAPVSSHTGGAGSLFVSSLTDIVFSQVLPFCDPHDWASVISTCRTCASTFKYHSGVPQFWRNAIRTHFLTPCKPYKNYYKGPFPPEEHIYWDDSFEPPDGETTYTFKPSLKWTTKPRTVVISPVIDVLQYVRPATSDEGIGGSTTATMEVEMCRRLFETMLELNRVISKMGCLGGLRDVYPYMIALPWDPAKEVTAVGVLEALGAHAKLINTVQDNANGVTVLNFLELRYEFRDNEDDLAAARLYHATMSHYEDAGSRFGFIARYEKLNPFPMFELASFCGRRLVMGAVTGVVSTLPSG